ncbi:hypothetical protein HYFRA_00010738 [Hymenoscyphus fraxineus]|uniref:HD domain-containing protein n=1 Tax=Hymenoscyphus fraxineus TaxID=746836 RepID=A0A9N9L401_9HELO|nr:hypothetical protein HYFRA_00010738 [Hymenoscyphus fraxineus]
MNPKPSTRVLAGVTIPDTPLIRKAIEYAQTNLTEFMFNHIMRSFLFGQIIADGLPSLQSRDNELHAVAAILHDIGWSQNKDLVSKDKRFEIDGANAARAFLMEEGRKEEWDVHRLQLAWDCIALHTTPSIGLHKEVEVQACGIGIFADFQGPERSFGGVLTRKEWDVVNKEFPRAGFRDGVKEVMCQLCIDKPETTYDNFVAGFGTAFVPGYKPTTFLDGIWAKSEG